MDVMGGRLKCGGDALRSSGMKRIFYLGGQVWEPGAQQ